MQNVGDPIRQLARQNRQTGRQFGENGTKCVETRGKLTNPSLRLPFQPDWELAHVRVVQPVLHLLTVLSNDLIGGAHGLGDRMSA